MRLWPWFALGAVVVTGAATSGVLLLDRSGPAAVAPQPTDNPSITPAISVATTAVVQQPPPPPQVPAVPADASPAHEGPTLDELPAQEVEPLPVHTVPDATSGPVPHVTIQDQQGRPLKRVATSAPPPPSYVPSVGPGSDGSFSSTPPPSYKPSVATGPDYIAPSPPPASYRPSVGPALTGTAPSRPPPSYQPSVPAPNAAVPPVQETAALTREPSSLSGPAHATGTLSLAVDGQSVRLYGVLPPARTDRCAIGTGAPQSCEDVTQAMLAAKLARAASVTCQLPTGATLAEPTRVCRDAGGVDIASYLVSEGLAVADPHAKGGYVSAESAARSSGKGLWRFR
jgi:endonuclease YncB( thermonuclease family)